MTYSIQEWVMYRTSYYNVVNSRGLIVASCHSLSMARRVKRGMQLEWEERQKRKAFRL